MDDFFTVSPKRVIELSQRMVEEKPDLWWWSFSRIEPLLRNEEMVRAGAKHDHLSFIRLEWLLLKANLLYCTRSKKAIQDIWHHIKKHRLGIRTLFRFIKDHFWG